MQKERPIKLGMFLNLNWPPFLRPSLRTHPLGSPASSLPTSQFGPSELALTPVLNRPRRCLIGWGKDSANLSTALTKWEFSTVEVPTARMLKITSASPVSTACWLEVLLSSLNSQTWWRWVMRLSDFAANISSWLVRQYAYIAIDMIYIDCSGIIICQCEEEDPLRKPSKRQKITSK